MVESVRIGTVIAQDRKAASRWRGRSQRARGKAGLSGQGLETAISALAMTHPEYVVVGA